MKLKFIEVPTCIFMLHQLIYVAYELHQAKRGLMVILKIFVRYISAFDYYAGIY